MRSVLRQLLPGPPDPATGETKLRTRRNIVPANHRISASSVRESTVLFVRFSFLVPRAPFSTEGLVDARPRNKGVIRYGTVQHDMDRTVPHGVTCRLGSPPASGLEFDGEPNEGSKSSSSPHLTTSMGSELSRGRYTFREYDDIKLHRCGLIGESVLV